MLDNKELAFIKGDFNFKCKITTSQDIFINIFLIPH